MVLLPFSCKMPNDRDDSLPQVQETKYHLMEIGITIVQFHPSRRAEHSLSVTILMTYRYCMRVLLLDSVAHMKEDVHLSLRRSWCLGCFRLYQMILMWVICKQQSEGSPHIVLLTWSQSLEWPLRNKHLIPMQFVLVFLHVDSFLLTRCFGPFPPSSGACVPSHPPPSSHPSPVEASRDKGHQPGSLPVFFPI